MNYRPGLRVSVGETDADGVRYGRTQLPGGSTKLSVPFSSENPGVVAAYWETLTR